MKFFIAKLLFIISVLFVAEVTVAQGASAANANFGASVHLGEGLSPRNFRLTFGGDLDFGFMTGPGFASFLYGGKRFFLGESYLGFGTGLSAGTIGFYGAVGYEYVSPVFLTIGGEFNAKGNISGNTTAEGTISLGFMF